MGTTTTANYGWTKPDGNEPRSNWPAQWGASVDDIDQEVDALNDRITTLENDVNPTTVQSVQATSIIGVTSTTLIPGSPACGHSFTAPPSGKVIVVVSGLLQNQSATDAVILGFEIREGGTVGSGTVVLAGSDERAVVTGNTDDDQIGASFTYLHTGLTAGNTYNVQTLHAVSTGGNGDINQRQILTMPVLS